MSNTTKRTMESLEGPLLADFRRQTSLIAEFSKVYGLLLVREGFRTRHQTHMYIRLFDGDAISQPSMYCAHKFGYGLWIHSVNATHYYL